MERRARPLVAVGLSGIPSAHVTGEGHHRARRPTRRERRDARARCRRRRRHAEREGRRRSGWSNAQSLEVGVDAHPSPRQVRAEPKSRLRARRTVAVGADHGGATLKDAVIDRLREIGHDVTDLGTSGTAAVDYPDYAIAVARAVAGGAAQVGIMVDGAGIGSCMAANKIAGARAAMCYDVTTAQNAREHNNANVLTLGGGLIGPRLALAIVETFLSTPFGGGRHATRVAKIDALDAPRAQR